MASTCVVTARPDASLPHRGRVETDSFVTERRRAQLGDMVFKKL